MKNWTSSQNPCKGEKKPPLLCHQLLDLLWSKGDHRILDVCKSLVRAVRTKQDRHWQVSTSVDNKRVSALCTNRNANAALTYSWSTWTRHSGETPRHQRWRSWDTCSLGGMWCWMSDQSSLWQLSTCQKDKCQGTGKMWYWMLDQTSLWRLSTRQKDKSQSTGMMWCQKYALMSYFQDLIQNAPDLILSKHTKKKENHKES